MNPAQPPAATDRSHTLPEEPAAEEPLAEHAKPTLRTRLHIGVTAVLGAGKALRQRLGKKTDGIQDTEAGADADSRESVQDEAAAPPTPSALPADTPTEPPLPTRRLRAYLLPVGVLVAGGIGGGALAYTLLQHQLGQQLKEGQRREAALSKAIRPAADIRKALEDEKARRIKAEEKLASAAAEYAKSTAEKQKELEAAEMHPATLRLAEGPRTDSGRAPPLKSGDCTLDAKNIGALKRCIEEFNR